MDVGALMDDICILILDDGRLIRIDDLVVMYPDDDSIIVYLDDLRDLIIVYESEYLTRG